MQVNSSNGSLQQRFFSGTGSIGGIHLPDFNDKYIFSKKKSGVSDKEYRKQIRGIWMDRVIRFLQMRFIEN